MKRNLLLMVVWVVLMMFWLFYGCYSYYDNLHPWSVSMTVIPWLCVAIVGYFVFEGNVPNT